MASPAAPAKFPSAALPEVTGAARDLESRAPTHIRIKRGLDIPIGGAPRQEVADGPTISAVGLMAEDYPAVRPDFRVTIGQRVIKGQTLFVDRRRPQIAFTAPAAGVVTSVIGREVRDPAQSLEIHLEGDGAKTFDPPGPTPGRETAQDLLLTSGLWPAFRTRPFGRIPDPESVPDAIFVTAIESDPLAADAAIIIKAYQADFLAGLAVLECLTSGPLFVCQAPGPALVEGAVTFAGPHPAGLPGTHIHYLHPVNDRRTVWHLNYQDTIAIGHLFTRGRLWTDRIVALAGPGVREPRLVRTQQGTSLENLTAGALCSGDLRVITGSVLSGRKASYLGRYHLQVSVIAEGWDTPKALFPPKVVSTALNGARGPLLPVAAFDRVMPLDILPVPLLRALSVGDRETAERLGCLELVEEDVALLSYVCPGKNDYGPLLRDVLENIEADH